MERPPAGASDLAGGCGTRTSATVRGRTWEASRVCWSEQSTDQDLI